MQREGKRTNTNNNNNSNTHTVTQLYAWTFTNLSILLIVFVCSNKEAVTDELVELVYGPSCDSNAREVFISVITGELTFSLLLWIHTLLFPGFDCQIYTGQYKLLSDVCLDAV